MKNHYLEYLRCWLSICHQGKEVDILEPEMIGDLIKDSLDSGKAHRALGITQSYGDNAPLVGNVSAEKRD